MISIVLDGILRHYGQFISSLELASVKLANQSSSSLRSDFGWLWFCLLTAPEASVCSFSYVMSAFAFTLFLPPSHSPLIVFSEKRHWLAQAIALMSV